MNYRRASRPYVCADELELESTTFRVSNAPARIKHLLIESWLFTDSGKEPIHIPYIETDCVRFPLGNNIYDWSTPIPNIHNKLREIQKNEHMERHLKITYTGLSGGKTYFYESWAKFSPGDENWQNIREDAL